LVVNRSEFGHGVPIRTETANATHATLATDFYSVSLAVETKANGCVAIGATVSSNNTVVWSSADLTSVTARLRWPDPAQSPAYAIKDYPRFFVPSWGPTPIPQPQKSAVDPALVATNGYDFRQNVDGDVYIFLGLETMEGWVAGRADFITLAGRTPLLPDWAFGVWYTWWYPYNESFAKAEILNWSSHKLPLVSS
jgi:alpha-glucosidase (family GH31 glycosyl hydrolase)